MNANRIDLFLILGAKKKKLFGINKKAIEGLITDFCCQ
jgi:hypothetical protein